MEIVSHVFAVLRRSLIAPGCRDVWPIVGTVAPEKELKTMICGETRVQTFVNSTR